MIPLFSRALLFSCQQPQVTLNYGVRWVRRGMEWKAYSWFCCPVVLTINSETTNGCCRIPTNVHKRCVSQCRRARIIIPSFFLQYSTRTPAQRRDSWSLSQPATRIATFCWVRPPVQQGEAAHSLLRVHELRKTRKWNVAHKLPTCTVPSQLPFISQYSYTFFSPQKYPEHVPNP